MNTVFKHQDLKLINPAFDSKLTSLILELDHLRRRSLKGTTHPSIFFQLKSIFHTLESIGSARIEGNNTTIAEYIEVKLEDDYTQKLPPNIQEIYNMEKAIEFIEEIIKDGHPINKIFVSELHKKVTEKLLPPPRGEGDKTPGAYRSIQVKISKSQHIPPDPYEIPYYMDGLFSFINKEDLPQYDLLKTAIAHHRFVWVHPFTNGNGRTVRLLTYAMLVKQGFNVHLGRIINPTAIFCNDRNHYYKYLSEADSGTDDGISKWCEYVLQGLVNELNKIDRLLDYKYLKNEILLAALDHAFANKYITDVEMKILKSLIEKETDQILKASDLKNIFPGIKNPSIISRMINGLKEKKMLAAKDNNSRKYILRFDNNYLLRSVIKQLGEKGFLPIKEDI